MRVIGGIQVNEQTTHEFKASMTIETVSDTSASDAYYRLGKKLESLGAAILKDYDRARSVMAP